MGLAKEIQRLEAANAGLRAAGCRLTGPPRTREKSLCKELSALEAENLQLKAAKARLTARASTAQAEPTAAPVSRRGLTVAQKEERARQPAEPDGFERIGPYLVYDAERLKAAKTKAARRQLEQRVQEDRS